MDFKKLKEIAKHLGGILVMEGENPEFVIMDYAKFSTLESPAQTVPVSQGTSQEEEMIDTLNKEILALKEEIRQKELSEAETI